MSQTFMLCSRFRCLSSDLHSCACPSQWSLGKYHQQSFKKQPYTAKWTWTFQTLLQRHLNLNVIISVYGFMISLPHSDQFLLKYLLSFAEISKIFRLFLNTYLHIYTLRYLCICKIIQQLLVFF